MSTGLAFLAVAVVIVVAGTRLARYGDVIGERSGLGRSWVGLVLLAATTSLPELCAGLGATALADLPDIAVGDVFGSCLFNLLILSMMDAVEPEPLSARAHQGHVLSIGFGMLMLGLAGLGALAGARTPSVVGVGVVSPVLVVTYLVAMRLTFRHEQARLRQQAEPGGAESSGDERASLRVAVGRYAMAAIVVVAAALVLPSLGADVARQTGLGEAFVGSLFIACATSLPEVVVSLAAVRLGAVDLAVGNVLGSNLFNLLILAIDDVAYRPGPLLAATEPTHLVTLLAAMAMQAVFLVALTYRVLTKRFRVSWDTAIIAGLYGVAVMLMYVLRT